MSELERCDRCQAAIIGDPWTNGIDTLCRECCIADVNHSAALHSAEREVLEACVEEEKADADANAAHNAGYDGTVFLARGRWRLAGAKRIAATRRLCALLDGKAEGKEA